MVIRYSAEFAENLLELFQGGKYELYVVQIMNRSKSVFPGSYFHVDKQPRGECDFICTETQAKFDAKLPFLADQMELLIDNNEHDIDIIGWIGELQAESSEFDVDAMRNRTYDVSRTKLYQIMRELIDKDKQDESIVFFFPYPISLSVRDSMFSQLASDFLMVIFDRLSKEFDFRKRSVYAIYPASEENLFAVRDLKIYRTEFIECPELGRYFTYEMTDVQIE